MYEVGLKAINDVSVANGNILIISEIRHKFPELKSNFLDIKSILSAIPIEWKVIMREGEGRHDNQAE